MNTAHRILNKSIAALCAAISLSIMTTVSVGAVTEKSDELAATEPKTGSKVMLSEEEKKIATDLDFDPAVVLLLKQTLSPQMAIGSKGGLERDEGGFSSLRNHNQPLLEEDRQNYLKIKSEHPALAPIINRALDFYLPPEARRSQFGEAQEKQMSERFGKEKYARMKKFMAAMEPYLPLLQQSALENSKGSVRSHGFLDENSEAFSSDEALEKAISEMQKQFVGQTVKPENRGTPYLSIKFWGVGDTQFSEDKRITKLRSELEELGYRITEESRPPKESRVFKSRPEAEKFLHETGTPLGDMFALQEQKVRTFKAIYPVHPEDWRDDDTAQLLTAQQSSIPPGKELPKLLQAQMLSGQANIGLPFPVLQIPPGSSVKSIGDRLWSIDVPPRFTANAIIRIASIMKIPKDSIGIELIRANGTDGTNYGMSTEEVIDRLQLWDKKYGVSVSEASHDSMTVEFKNLPEDLSELCTEFFLFCPDLVDLYGDENANAAAMRNLANGVKRTHKVHFWWD